MSDIETRIDILSRTAIAMGADFSEARIAIFLDELQAYPPDTLSAACSEVLGSETYLSIASIKKAADSLLGSQPAKQLAAPLPEKGTYARFEFDTKEAICDGLETEDFEIDFNAPPWSIGAWKEQEVRR